MMDAQLKSILTSIALAGATALTTWLVSHGYIPGSDQSTFTADIMTAGAALATAALGWYKERQHTPAAQIQAVNAADNGVKVVAADAAAKVIDVPLKNVK